MIYIFLSKSKNDFFFPLSINIKDLFLFDLIKYQLIRLREIVRKKKKRANIVNPDLFILILKLIINMR